MGLRNISGIYGFLSRRFRVDRISRRGVTASRCLPRVGHSRAQWGRGLSLIRAWRDSDRPGGFEEVLRCGSGRKDGHEGLVVLGISPVPARGSLCAHVHCGVMISFLCQPRRCMPHPAGNFQFSRMVFFISTHQQNEDPLTNWRQQHPSIIFPTRPLAR